MSGLAAMQFHHIFGDQGSIGGGDLRRFEERLGGEIIAVTGSVHEVEYIELAAPVES